MSLKGRTVNQYVIQKDHHKFSQKWGQDIIHDALKGGRGIGQPKWHDLEVIQLLMCFENSLVFILRFHSYLMITGFHVQLCKIFTASQFLQDLFNDRHRKSVLDGQGI